jgi:hypothetical protein
VGQRAQTLGAQQLDRGLQHPDFGWRHARTIDGDCRYYKFS